MKRMKLTTLAVASAFALCSTSVFGQSAGSSAGGNSKAGGPDYLLLFTQAKTIAEKIGYAGPTAEKQSEQMGM